MIPKRASLSSAQVHTGGQTPHLSVNGKWRCLAGTTKWLLIQLITLSGTRHADFRCVWIKMHVLYMRDQLSCHVAYKRFCAAQIVHPMFRATLGRLRIRPTQDHNKHDDSFGFLDVSFPGVFLRSVVLCFLFGANRRFQDHFASSGYIFTCVKTSLDGVLIITTSGSAQKPELELGKASPSEKRQTHGTRTFINADNQILFHSKHNTFACTRTKNLVKVWNILLHFHLLTLKISINKESTSVLSPQELFVWQPYQNDTCIFNNSIFWGVILYVDVQKKFKEKQTSEHTCTA